MYFIQKLPRLCICMYNRPFSLCPQMNLKIIACTISTILRMWTLKVNWNFSRKGAWNRQAARYILISRGARCWTLCLWERSYMGPVGVWHRQNKSDRGNFLPYATSDFVWGKWTTGNGQLEIHHLPLSVLLLETCWIPSWKSKDKVIYQFPTANHLTTSDSNMELQEYIRSYTVSCNWFSRCIQPKELTVECIVYVQCIYFPSVLHGYWADAIYVVSTLLYQ